MRTLLARAIVTAAVLTVVAGGTAVAAPVPQTPWFVDQVGNATQVVSVRAGEDSTAQVSAWELAGSDWVRMIGDVDGFVGSDGIAPASKDGVPATPAGVFDLPSTFGTEPDPEGSLPYLRVGPNDWWDGDPGSPDYNTHQVCVPGSCPFDEDQSEQLAIDVYRYAVVMGVNSARVPTDGGAFFLHVTDGTPTDGCVAVDEQSLLSIIRWLRPGAVIAID